MNNVKIEPITGLTRIFISEHVFTVDETGGGYLKEGISFNRQELNNAASGCVKADVDANSLESLAGAIFKSPGMDIKYQPDGSCVFSMYVKSAGGSYYLDVCFDRGKNFKDMYVRRAYNFTLEALSVKYEVGDAEIHPEFNDFDYSYLAVDDDNGHFNEGFEADWQAKKGMCYPNNLIDFQYYELNREDLGISLLLYKDFLKAKSAGVEYSAINLIHVGSDPSVVPHKGEFSSTVCFVHCADMSDLIFALVMWSGGDGVFLTNVFALCPQNMESFEKYYYETLHDTLEKQYEKHGKVNSLIQIK